MTNHSDSEKSETHPTGRTRSNSAPEAEKTVVDIELPSLSPSDSEKSGILHINNFDRRHSVDVVRLQSGHDTSEPPVNLADNDSTHENSHTENYPDHSIKQYAKNLTKLIWNKFSRDKKTDPACKTSSRLSAANNVGSPVFTAEKATKRQKELDLLSKTTAIMPTHLDSEITAHNTILDSLERSFVMEGTKYANDPTGMLAAIKAMNELKGGSTIPDNRDTPHSPIATPDDYKRRGISLQDAPYPPANTPVSEED